MSKARRNKKVRERIEREALSVVTPKSLPVVEFMRDAEELRKLGVSSSGSDCAEEYMARVTGLTAFHALRARIEVMKRTLDGVLERNPKAIPEREMGNIIRDQVYGGGIIPILEAVTGRNAGNLEIALLTKGAALNRDHLLATGDGNATKIVESAERTLALRLQSGTFPLAIPGENGIVLDSEYAVIPSDMITSLFMGILEAHFDANYERADGRNIRNTYKRMNGKSDPESTKDPTRIIVHKRDGLLGYCAAGLMGAIALLNGMYKSKDSEKYQEPQVKIVYVEKEVKKDDNKENDGITPKKQDISLLLNKNNNEKEDVPDQSKENSGESKDKGIEKIVTEKYEIKLTPETITVSPYKTHTTVRFGYDCPDPSEAEKIKFKESLKTILEEAYNHYKAKYGTDISDFKDKSTITLNWESTASPDGSEKHNRSLAKGRELATEDVTYEVLDGLNIKKERIKITRTSTPESISLEDTAALTERAVKYGLSFEEYIARFNERGEQIYGSQQGSDEYRICQETLGKSRATFIKTIEVKYDGPTPADK